jgi:hypothetical protein
MNRLITFAGLLLTLWFVWRRYRGIFRRFWGGAAPQPQTGPKKVANGPVTLERDPVTGVFRPPER